MQAEFFLQELHQMDLTAIRLFISELYIDAFKAESFIWFELRLERKIQHPTETLEKQKAIKQAIELSCALGHLLRIINAHGLLLRFNLYLTNYQEWESRYIDKYASWLGVDNPHNISRKSLHVVK